MGRAKCTAGIDQGSSSGGFGAVQGKMPEIYGFAPPSAIYGQGFGIPAEKPCKWCIRIDIFRMPDALAVSSKRLPPSILI